MEAILPFTRSLVTKVVKEGDLVVDATMGNGMDTLFMAKLVGVSGKVLAYDIQESALKSTQERLAKAGSFPQVELYQKGHQTLDEELSQFPQSVSAAMFNLGYLPGGDKQIATDWESTMTALTTLAAYLKKGGLITVVIYSGHPQGKLEKEIISQQLRLWPQNQYHILQYQFINQRNDPPFLLAIQKR